MMIIFFQKRYHHYQINTSSKQHIHISDRLSLYAMVLVSIHRIANTLVFIKPGQLRELKRFINLIFNLEINVLWI